jgi:ubiquitin-conjugating enzyme E2 J2
MYDTSLFHKRLTREYLALEKSPAPYFIAKPLESNILGWHYVLTGPKGTPYEGGVHSEYS